MDWRLFLTVCTKENLNVAFKKKIRRVYTQRN